MSETFVIVGGGHTAGRAAVTLRQEGYKGRLVIAGAEPHHPYMRPMLSKEYLRGDSPIDEAYIEKEDWYRKNEVELNPKTRVTKLSPHASEVTLSDGQRIHYTKLLIATGAQPRRLGIKGDDLPGVHYLRTIEDSDSIRRHLRKGKHIVVIGGGWIACEVAASARQKGAKVSVVMRHPTPFVNILGKEMGKWYKELHESHGVEFIKGSPKEFVGPGPVKGVRLHSQTIPADAIVVGAGIEPDTELAEQAGLPIDNGIPTNQYLETETKHIYAAGDVANAEHPFYRQHLRVEHWANAHNQGEFVARNMLGQKRPFDKLPYFFSDQYDTGMEYIGHAPEYEEVVFRGDLKKKEFTAFWLRKGKVLAGLAMNGATTAEMIEALILDKRKVDKERLADPATPLATLL